MSPSWKTYRQLIEDAKENSPVVEDALALPVRWKGSVLQRFYGQIMELKKTERSQQLKITKLPFQDLINYVSVVMGNVDIDQDSVEAYLQQDFSRYASNVLLEYMAKVTYKKLNLLFDSVESGENCPEMNVCFLTTTGVSGTRYRVDINISATTFKTPDPKKYCGKVVTVSALIFIVDRDYVSDFDTRDTILKATYTGIQNNEDWNKIHQEFDESGSQKSSNKSAQSEPIEDYSNSHLLAMSTSYLSKPEDEKKTYFLSLPMGTASPAAPLVKSWFTSGILSRESPPPFSLAVREVGDLGNRLEIDVTGKFSEAPSMTDSSAKDGVQPMFLGLGSIIPFLGKILVTNVAAPLIAHHFGEKK